MKITLELDEKKFRNLVAATTYFKFDSAETYIYYLINEDLKDCSREIEGFHKGCENSAEFFTLWEKYKNENHA